MGDRTDEESTQQAPMVTFTLRSGVCLQGRPALWRSDKILMIATTETVTALDIDAVTAVSVPASAPQAAGFLSDPAVEVVAADNAQRDTAAIDALHGRAKVLAARFGVKFKIDPALAKDPATLVGMDGLIDDVQHALSRVVEVKPGALEKALDGVWLGRGARAGVFLSQRRLEMRARLEEGKAGRLEADALQKAIEAVL